MDRNIAAFTPVEHPYPQYVSINDRDGLIEITVRSPADADDNCGPIAAIRMTREAFKALIDEAARRL